jgi:hypothetical protein
LGIVVGRADLDRPRIAQKNSTWNRLPWNYGNGGAGCPSDL